MTTTSSIGFGVLGARSMVARRAVIPALDVAAGAHLAAAASLGGEVPPACRGREVATYEAVIDAGGVDAVYIPLPNGMHREWVLRAIEAGVPVLCEKPLGVDAADVEVMAAAAAAADVLVAEAWMTPFDRRWQRMLDLIADGVIGTIRHVDAVFTFTIESDRSENYRWDPGQGGGALLDVGIYTLGVPTFLWGTDPAEIEVDRTAAESGVDARTRAELRWDDDRAATITCSFVDEDRQELTVVGTAGSLHLRSDAFTGGHGADTIEVIRTDGGAEVLRDAGSDPYQGMVETFAACVRGGSEWPRPIERSIELARLLDRIARS